MLVVMYKVFYFLDIGMGLSQRNAIHRLVLLETTSHGISLCDAGLR